MFTVKISFLLHTKLNLGVPLWKPATSTTSPNLYLYNPAYNLIVSTNNTNACVKTAQHDIDSRKNKMGFWSSETVELL